MQKGLTVKQVAEIADRSTGWVYSWVHAPDGLKPLKSPDRVLRFGFYDLLAFLRSRSKATKGFVIRLNPEKVQEIRRLYDNVKD